MLQNHTNAELKGFIIANILTENVECDLDLSLAYISFKNIKMFNMRLNINTEIEK